MDSLPPPPPAISAAAPSDIHPRSAREKELCDAASHPDWAYLGGLAAIGAAGIAYGSWQPARDSSSLPVRFVAPAVVGLTWGSIVGGAWLAAPKCDPNWVAGSPNDGNVRSHGPLTWSLALLAAFTAPIVNGVVVGFDLPVTWTTFEREMHLATAAVAGFAGSMLPYLLPPRTWSAARELDHLRFGADARGASVSYVLSF